MSAAGAGDRRRVKDMHKEAEVLNDLGEVYRRCQHYSAPVRATNWRWLPIRAGMRWERRR